MPNQPSGLLLTGGDVLWAEYDLLCHPATHADVHLGQQLRARLAPAVVLREHGHLARRTGEEGGGGAVESD